MFKFITALAVAVMAVAMPAMAQDTTSASASASVVAPAPAASPAPADSGAATLTADEAAAHKGDIAAIRRTMQHYLDAGDAKAALPWAKMGAEKGDTACQIALANLLSGGDAGPADLVHAYMWADIAVAKHDADLAPDAEAARDSIRHKATVDQILDAKALSAKWRAAHK